MSSNFASTRIGRTSEAARIQNVINEWIAAPAKSGKFLMVGISGYGGVGKSFLLNGVLAEQQLERRDVIPVRLDGSNKQLLSDLMAMIDEKMAPRDIRFKGSRLGDEQFPETRKLAIFQRKLEAKVHVELNAKDVSDELKKAAKVLYKFTPLIRQIPKAGEVLATLLDASEKLKVEEYAEPAAELLKNLKALKPTHDFRLRECVYPCVSGSPSIHSRQLQRHTRPM